MAVETSTAGSSITATSSVTTSKSLKRSPSSKSITPQPWKWIPFTTLPSISSPKVKSVSYMTLALSVHFAGYELARSAVMAMFTSSSSSGNERRMGFGDSPAMLPLAVGCVSPFSIFLLWSYTKVLDQYGPRYALWRTTITCSTVMFLGGYIIYHFSPSGTTIFNTTTLEKTKRLEVLMNNILVFFLFVFQNSNVQLLHTQHWSFLGSVLTQTEGAVWFAPIAGIGSIASTFGAASVTFVVDRVGLTGTLCTAGFIIALSGVLADNAYRISQEHGFLPDKTKDSMNKKKADPPPKAASQKDCSDTGTSASREDGKNIIKNARLLFKSVPVLGALFSEVLISQCLSSLINFLFVIRVKDMIVDDKQRAGWMGKCYSLINGVSGILQFFVLPLMMKRINQRLVWLIMPVIMNILLSLRYMEIHTSMLLVGSFFAMKVMEYSIRGAASEMLYSSLDYESRFIGKEVIGLLANRLGKSGMALGLSLLTFLVDEKDSTLQNFLSLSCSVVACLWLVFCYRLTMQLEPID